jgi:AcrR family transcriptional regulator
MRTLHAEEEVGKGVGDDVGVDTQPGAAGSAAAPDAALPETIAKAWGLREPKGKGPRPGLTLDRVVDTAVTLARTEGLAAVSMARVAAGLGVSTMGLYRYVSGKNELLTLMVDRAWGGPPQPSPGGGGWRSGLTDWARAMHAAGLRDPWVVTIPIASAPATPNQVAWMDACFAALDGTGLTPGECASVLLLLSGYVRNQVALVASLMAALATDPEAARLMGSYRQVLARVADPARFPALAAAVAAGAFDDEEGEAGDESLDTEFTFGLERILDGVEALIRSRG